MWPKYIRDVSSPKSTVKLCINNRIAHVKNKVHIYILNNGRMKSSVYPPLKKVIFSNYTTYKITLDSTHIPENPFTIPHITREPK